MLLSALIFLPFFFVMLVLLAPETLTKGITFVATSVHFAFSLLLFKHFDPSTADLQLVEKSFWLQELGVSYFLAIYGISFWLVILTTFLTPVVVAASWSTINKHVKAFHISLLVLEAAMIGSFVSFDTILFYMFF